jgi:hypothetical protein
MFYFDANVFLLPQIYDLDIEEAAKAKEYLTALAEGKIEGCTSTLTWDEVIHVIRKYSSFEECVAARSFLSFPNLKIVNVDLEITSIAQRIVEEFKVLPRDSIHAACALKYCNGVIISNDSDFDAIKEVKRRF